MKLSLYIKIVFAYITFAILSFITIANLSSKLTYDYLSKSRSAILYDEANLIANTYSSNYSGSDIKLEQAYPQLKLVSTFLQADVWIIDTDGTIILDSSGKRNKQVIKDFNPINLGKNKTVVRGNYFNSFNYEVISALAPITGNYKTYGYVAIHLPISKLNADAADILNIVYLTGLIIFLLSLFILLIFHIYVYKPLKTITFAAKEYAIGNLSYQVEVDSNDEMGYLANTLNFMSDELYKAEDYQKTFITNISHDFRSPLTSIKGFLEAILDGTIPYEMQNKYIERILNETKRLSKLTNGILTLKLADAKGYLRRTNFDINRIIKDTIASFEGQCMDKGLSFDLTFSDNVIMVNADIGKIQQVLYNLIDNAIKFSNSNSSIHIACEKKYEKIFISIKDTGVGIPKEHIKKIFDRFYKLDTSRGKDKKGTGLGLAIVKDIINSHGETIDVISTEGIGSEFVFTLSKAKDE